MVVVSSPGQRIGQRRRYALTVVAHSGHSSVRGRSLGATAARDHPLPRTLRRPRDLPADPPGDNLCRRAFCHLTQDRGILNVHSDRRLREFIDTHDWITCCFLPSYAPDLNPVEGIWPLLRRSSQANTAFTEPDHLMNALRHGLRQIQYRSNLVDGRLSETGLTLTTSHERETAGRPFAQASSHQPLIAAGHRLHWSLPGHLIGAVSCPWEARARHLFRVWSGVIPVPCCVEGRFRGCVGSPGPPAPVRRRGGARTAFPRSGG